MTRETAPGEARTQAVRNDVARRIASFGGFYLRDEKLGLLVDEIIESVRAALSEDGQPPMERLVKNLFAQVEDAYREGFNSGIGAGHALSSATDRDADRQWLESNARFDTEALRSVGPTPGVERRTEPSEHRPDCAVHYPTDGECNCRDLDAAQMAEIGAPQTLEAWLKYTPLFLNESAVERACKETQGPPEALTIGLWTYGYVEGSFHEKTEPKTCIGHFTLRDLLALNALRRAPQEEGERPIHPDILAAMRDALGHHLTQIETSIGATRMTWNAWFPEIPVSGARPPEGGAA